jgi:hypothetical protein
MLVFIYILLLPEEAWELSKNSALSEIWEHWIDKFFHFLYPTRTGHEGPEGSRGIALLFL